MDNSVKNLGQLNQPFLICYTFFSTGHEARDWLSLSSTQRETLRDEQNFEIDEGLYLQPDGYAVYLSVDQPEKNLPVDSWYSLWKQLAAVVQDEFETNSQILGTTLYFGAEVSKEWHEQQIEQKCHWLENLSWPFVLEQESLTLTYSSQNWGQVWQVVHRNFSEQKGKAHVYVVLYTASQKEQALQKVAGQFELLELFLHKAYQQAAHYLQYRKSRLYDDNEKQNQLLQDIFMAETVEQKRLKLLELSTENIYFIRWRTEVVELTQTVQINLENFQQKASEFGLLHSSDEVFKVHITRLQRELTQLQYDQTYYQAMKERLSDSLQLLRADITMQQLEQDRQLAAVTKQQEVRKNNHNQRLAHLIGMLTILFAVPGMWQMFESMMKLYQWPNPLQVVVLRLFVGTLTVAILGYIIWIWWSYKQSQFPKGEKIE